MAAVERVAVEAGGARDLALIGADDSVWIVVPVRWWDLATLVWWLLCPAQRKANVTLTTRDGDGSTARVSFRAVRMASRHIKVRKLFTAAGD